MDQLTQIHTIKGHEEAIWCLDWSPFGNLLASCGADKTIILWATVNGKFQQVQKFDDIHDRTIRKLSFSPDGRYLAAASFDGTISIYQKDHTGLFHLSMTLEGHENEVKGCTWSSNGIYLATCSRDKTVWIWELEGDNDIECVAVCAGHSQDVKAVSWHSPTNQLLSCSYDDSIKIWTEDIDEDDWFCTGTLRNHTSTVWDISFNAIGDTMASIGSKGKIILYTYNPSIESTWEVFQTIDDASELELYSVDWSRENILGVAGRDDHVHLYQKNNNTGKYELFSKTKAHEADVNTLSWNPTEPKILATGGDDGVINIWEISV
eukprot:TRINITY_DN4800_c0_g1_i1.p1 TRINITY_DN4800_c0_g1~~TRINITY_DN4800_c0_g1_i1.p1  ORF type:complete len:321 (-),score=81.95 TRINITY_DN4800_c0_g1_i1:55-1017(-)